MDLVGESDEWAPLIRGIGFSGYRSFAAGWQPLDLRNKVTVLAGINNSGKSNVLHYLQHVLPHLKGGRHQQRPSPVSIEGLDVPNGFLERSHHVVGVALDATKAVEYVAKLRRPPQPSNGVQVYPEYLMGRLANGDTYWSIFELDGNQFVIPASRVEEAISYLPNWAVDFRSVLNAIGGGPIDPDDVMRRLLSSLGGYENLPPVATIVASRRVELIEGDPEGDLSWLSGRGVINALSKLQNPPHSSWQEARTRWDAINRFIQVVLSDSTARINIPHDAATIQVETPSRVLPLSNLGSGIEQVIVLASAATVLQRTLVCIEEPETNLHPLLQKKLVRYLTDETDNQYVIATHSSHLLDDARAMTYHLRLTGTGTSVRPARKPHELVAICHDLGYRPSDLLQANCIIWVEGPSDRVYIRRWMELIDRSLAEGIDYSIMFYGGKLLSHLTVDAEALQDFIDLRKLSRSSAVVIDSDRTGPRRRINATKQRIQQEFEAEADSPGMAWVTKGYTVENYVPRDVLAAAVEEVHPGRSITGMDEQWDNPLKGFKDEPAFDKIAIARAVEPRLTVAHLDRLDLKARLHELVNFVYTANGPEARSSAPPLEH
ncbi:AAA family ATPase [Nocardioides lijunqiniae]|uniref:AAA family ATPase n=1 Tax=Nocardioides lijunqiniae TaxID=2760832 RepID=UPI0018781F59|nr:AAA family ATPase [Nocardioides lijunqiniae]